MDYQLRLVHRGGGCISNLEYKTWRVSGNAFDFRYGKNDDEEEVGSEPNNSLVSSLVTHKDGDRLSRRGYWGDIITGPFIIYGHDHQDKVRTYCTQ